LIGYGHRLSVNREPVSFNLVLCYLLQQLLRVDHRSRAKNQSRIRRTPGSRRKVIVYFRLWLRIDLVACVRAAHTDQEVVFWRNVPDDVSLSFASELTSYQHVDQRVAGSWVKAKKSCGPNKDGLFAAAIS